MRCGQIEMEMVPVALAREVVWEPQPKVGRWRGSGAGRQTQRSTKQPGRRVKALTPLVPCAPPSGARGMQGKVRLSVFFAHLFNKCVVTPAL